jgi:hypothetical protein
VGVFSGCFAIFLDVQIQRQVLDIAESLMPFLERLDIYRPDPPAALGTKCPNQVSPDESARAGDDNQVFALQNRSPLLISRKEGLRRRLEYHFCSRPSSPLMFKITVTIVLPGLRNAPPRRNGSNLESK